ncbi:MAG: hypothetical protein WEB13_09355 [Dehalococcoidia bacterium]
MTQRPLSDAELEATLRDLGARLHTPASPLLAQRVRARITEPEARRSRPWLFSLAPAVLTLLVIGAGAAATELVRVRGVDVFRVPAVTAVPLRPLDLGERGTLELARALVIPLWTSSDPAFATPDEIYLRRSGDGQVSFVYAARPGLRAGPTGHGALVTQHRGELEPGIIGKGVGPSSRIEQVTVAGAPGVWIEGEAHFFFYRDQQGQIREETLRLAGNTLLWERDGTLLRLEAQVGRERALEIAASFRPSR